MDEFLGLNPTSVFGLLAFALASAVVALWLKLNSLTKKDDVRDQKQIEQAYKNAELFTTTHSEINKQFTEKLENIHSQHVEKITALHEETIKTLTAHTQAIQEIKTYFEKKERVFDLIIKHIDKVQSLIIDQEKHREEQRILMASHKEEIITAFNHITKALFEIPNQKQY